MRQYITANTMLVEKKGLEAEQIPNNMNFVLCSNENILKIIEHDRRFVVPTMIDKRQSREYYDALVEDFANSDFPQEIFNYFKHRVASNPTFINTHTTIPTSEAKEEIMENVLCSIRIWIRDEIIISCQSLKLTLKRLYEKYKAHCKLNNVTPLGPKRLSQILLDLGYKSKKTRVDNEQGLYYCLDSAELFEKFKAKRWINESEEEMRAAQDLTRPNLGLEEATNLADDGWAQDLEFHE